ncbi:MAG: response regulator transcription factor [Bacteroidaceae bacterium]|nr:response regulator transcription factor [Bacteroidaceae bacterium]
MAQRILVVDDEPDIAEILQFNLEAEGYAVDTAFSAEEALGCLRRAMSGDDGRGYDLILLDVMMGEVSGFGLASLLRNDPQTADLPLIFITALGGEEERVKGLDIGADDYIAKPFSIAEMKARVRAVLRRAQHWQEKTLGTGTIDEQQTVRYQGIALDPTSKTVTVDGVAVTLTRLEFELLAFFLQHPGRVYAREELLDRLWPEDTVVLARTVDVNITRLRKKIEPYGTQIKTKIGYGYYFEI